MVKRRIISGFLAALVALTISTPCRADLPPGSGVEGVVGFTPVEENTYVAFFVPFSSAHALTGIRWFNNDGSVVFPRVLVCPGYLEGPGSITEAIEVAGSVTGQTLGWSDLGFSQPIASSREGLHVILQLPAGSEFQTEGLGGGCGFGYQLGETGVSGWISADGEEWIALSTGSRFAVDVSLVAVESGMVLMSASGGYTAVTAAGPPELAARGVIAAPNPFNPSVQVWYNLPTAARVQIDVFDLRGRRVRRLLSAERPAGADFVMWHGDDEGGRRLPSGSYVIVVRRGAELIKRSVVLLK